MCHLSTEFTWKPVELNSFCVILLTTNKLTTVDENTTSLIFRCVINTYRQLMLLAWRCGREPAAWRTREHLRLHLPPAAAAAGRRTQTSARGMDCWRNRLVESAANNNIKIAHSSQLLPYSFRLVRHWLKTARTLHRSRRFWVPPTQGRRSWGLRGSWPMKICRRRQTML